MEFKDIIEFKKAVGEIPILNDEGFKSGNVDHIDDRSAVHFLIYPFLNTLGYNIFKPDELKLNYVEDGKTADVVILESGSPLAVFKLLALNEIKNLDDVKVNFRVNGLPELNVFKAPLVVLTNGLEYVLYATNNGNGEELVHFNLLDIEGKKADFVFKVLFKSSLVQSFTNEKFFSEKIIESKFGNLRKSDYLIDLLEKELYQPSEKFVVLLAELIHKAYLKDFDIDVLKTKLAAELEDNPGDLLEAITGDRESVSSNLNSNSTSEAFNNAEDTGSFKEISTESDDIDGLVKETVNSEESNENENESIKDNNDKYDDWTKVQFEVADNNYNQEEKKIEPSTLGTSSNQFAQGKELNSILLNSENNDNGEDEDNRGGMDLNSLLNN